MDVIGLVSVILVVLVIPAAAQVTTYYLLVPPPVTESKELRAWPAHEAPLDRWRVEGAFDSSAACEARRSEKLDFWIKMLLARKDAQANPLKPDDFRIGQLRYYGAARCLPSEVISAPRRWYLLMPPAPFTDQAPLNQWQIKAGYYFAADCERVLRHARQIIEEHEAVTEALERPPGERGEEARERSARLFNALVSSKYVLFGELEQARYARCVAREALPPAMLPPK